MSIVDEIRGGLKKPGKTQRGLARAIGRDPAAVTRMLDGKRALKTDEIESARRYLELDEKPVEVASYHNDRSGHKVSKQFTQIPIFPISASSKADIIAHSKGDWGSMMFDLTWLNSISVNHADLFVLEVSGDSMWGTMNHGDHALVDPSQRDTRRDGLYVLRLEDQLQFKRISMHPVKRTLTLKSDNAAYPAFDDIAPEQIDVVGRVVWIGRRL